MPFPDYIQYLITVQNGPEIALEDRQDIIISEISDMPFETFEIQDEFIYAYLPALQQEEGMVENIKGLEGVLTVKISLIKGENWNKVWEESFDPINIGQNIIVRAPFHNVDKRYLHEIIIEPKMSFGTGHHSTTGLMMEKMLNVDFKNKSVLDMGCGTGILAILAHKLCASHITAVDNDPQCIENTLENLSLNYCQDIEVYLNDKISANFKVDIILANIQKNVLIEQMPLYKSWLNSNGTLLVSGIYEEAVNDIKTSANKQGFNYIEHNMLNAWCMIHFTLNSSENESAQ